LVRHFWSTQVTGALQSDGYGRKQTGWGMRPNAHPYECRKSTAAYNDLNMLKTFVPGQVNN